MTLAERAAAIEKVVKGMTPGPWRFANTDVRGSSVYGGPPKQRRVTICRNTAIEKSTRADAAGIVALRNDAPQLVADLVAENERMAKALAFYAHPLHYVQPTEFRPFDRTIPNSTGDLVVAGGSDVMKDKGETARLALAVTR